MCKNPNSAEDSDESARRAVEFRVNRLMSGAREQTAREMAEKVAGAILLGKPLDEFYFEDVESLDGVEEAIHHIISSARLRVPVETRVEDGAISGGPNEPCSGGEDPAAPIARATVDNLSAELEKSVKRAAASVKAKEGTDLWICTRTRIADLICAEILHSESPLGQVGQEDRNAPETETDTGQTDRATGPTSCRRLGMTFLSDGSAEVHGVPGAIPSALGKVESAVAENQEGSQRAYDHVLRGNELEPELAMDEYQKALAIDPSHVMAHFFLVQSFQDVGNLDAAVAEFSKVTWLAPDDADGHWCLGEALHEKGDLEAAAAEYARALRLAPKDEWVLEMYSSLDPWMKNCVREQTLKMQR